MTITVSSTYFEFFVCLLLTLSCPLDTVFVFIAEWVIDLIVKVISLKRSQKFKQERAYKNGAEY